MKLKMKNKEIRRLTWEHFLTQKLQGIFKFVSITFSIIFIPYWYGILMKSLNFIGWEFEKGIGIWMDGFILLFFSLIFFSLIIVGIVVLLIWLIIAQIVEWLKSNWEKAEAKAKRDLK